MLNLDDRRLYSQCFGAPDGFIFDCAVGTTYSLDLESLLFVQFCIATSAGSEPESALSDPVGLLEAIHRTTDRATVFCHAGETNAPHRPHALYALLERSIVPALGKSGGAIFHPKLWVLRFARRDTGDPWVRVVVLSRNLTTSRAWDSFLCLEGEPERGRCPGSAQLATLLTALPKLAISTVENERAEQIEMLSAEVARTQFRAPPPFDGNAEFITTGFGTQKGFAPADTGDRVLAISPFVSDNALRQLRELAPQAQLIGRPEEMAKCRSATIGAWEAFALDDAACSDVDTADSDDGTTADAAPQGLHAKILAVEKPRRTIWWFGSGNLTDPVREGTSVEVMVRLEGKTSKVGIQSFLDAGFQTLLVPYNHAAPPPDPQEGTRAAVERVKDALVRAPLQLDCEKDGNAWKVLLSGLPEFDDAVDTRCRPISLPESRSLPLQAECLCFEQVTIEALTALVCFRLTAGQADAMYETEFALKVPTVGTPNERDSCISQSIIKDRASFLHYLQCLLGAGDHHVLPSSPAAASARSHSDDSTGKPFASGLLEQLLRTLHEEPARLRGLRSLLERTANADDTTEAVVPMEFRQLWTVIEPHLRKEHST